ncbi:MAG: response regulator [Myxococcota bacterium]
MEHRLMLVSADPVGREADVTALLQEGWTAVGCADVEEAAARLSTFMPTVVLLVTNLDAPHAQLTLQRLYSLASLAGRVLVVAGPAEPVERVVMALGAGASAWLPWDASVRERSLQLQELVGTGPSDERFFRAVMTHGLATLERVHHLLLDARATGDLVLCRGRWRVVIPYRAGNAATEDGSPFSCSGLQPLVSSAAFDRWGVGFQPGVPTAPGHDEGRVLTPAQPTAIQPVMVRCLLVEPDATQRRHHARCLERMDMVVDTAQDGEQGLEMAFALRPDVIVSEVELPGMDGWRLLAEIRRNLRLRETPFFLTSHRTQTLELLEGAGTGANAYIPKSTRPDELGTRIREHLRRRRELVQRVMAGQERCGEVADVGPQALVRALGRSAQGVVLRVWDNELRAEVRLANGAILGVLADVRGVEKTGLEALQHVLTRDGGRFQVEPWSPGTDTVGGAHHEDVVDELCAVIEESADCSVTHLLATDAVLEFRGPLLDVYVLGRSDEERAVVEALARGAPPRELLFGEMFSPLVLDAVVEDLLCRGVATLHLRDGPPPPDGAEGLMVGA